MNTLHRFAPPPLPENPTGNPAQPPRHGVLEARVQALVDVYRRVQTDRMQGVALLNPALSVEAVGFAWAEGGDGAEAVAEGVLITPWFMSLLRLPARERPHSGQVGCKRVRHFGSECFEFIGGHDPAIGYHETCALFSPMQAFDTQELAVQTAQAALALTRPAAVETAPLHPAEPVPARRAFFRMGRPSTPGSAR